MAPSSLDKQTTKWELSNDLIETFAIDLVFCDMWGSNGLVDSYHLII